MSGEVLPEGWVALSPESGEQFAQEFHREAAPTHPLYGVHMTAIARRRTYDDFLFKLSEGRYADIHLTWAVETRPNVPSHQIHSSFDDWKKQLEEDANWLEGDE